jgi:hypothetical protein
MIMWAVAILSSAWTEWIFASKANNPDYKNNPEKSKAANNAMICYPYIRNSIMDAMSKSKEIGTKPPKFRPEGVCSKFSLKKEFNGQS